MRLPWLTVCLLILVAGCLRQPQADAPASPTPRNPDALDGARAMQLVSNLVALGPRSSGSDGAERAAAFIANELRASGIRVDIDAFQDETPAGTLTFRNILGTIPGDPHRWIVLLSHYDTKVGIATNFVGANDSGSSSGLLLALAAVLSPPIAGTPTILLGFMDGEECRHAYAAKDGLHGSIRLASKLTDDGIAPHVRAVILLDMVGDRDLTITIPRNTTPELVVAAFAAAKAAGIRDRFSLFSGSMLDDHVPFLQRGMPAIDLIDFQFGSAPGRNDYWHTPHDTLDKLSSDSLQHMGRVVIHMVNGMATH